MRLRLILVALVAAALSGFLAAGASADSGSASYRYLIGTGFVAGITPPVAIEGPAVAMAPNGDTIALTGSGTLGVHPSRSPVAGRSHTRALRAPSWGAGLGRRSNC